MEYIAAIFFLMINVGVVLGLLFIVSVVLGEEKKRAKKKKLTSEEKGAIGEEAIVDALLKLPGRYHIVKNMYIRKEDGNWTEIDIVAIHKTGIYVFESKNYGGWIFGSEDNRYWTQSFGKGNTQRFPNPIWQNKGHVTAIKEKVSPAIPIRSLVVFTKSNLKKAEYTETDSLKVLSLDELEKTMLEYNKEKSILTRTEINNLFKKFKGYTKPPKHIIEEHQNQIKERFKE